MRKLITVLFITLFSLFGYAQEGFQHLTFKGGYTIEEDMNIEIGYEFNMAHFNNWSIFFSYFESNKRSPELVNYTTGIYYEPNIYAAKNSFLNLKFGTSFGTNSKDFRFDVIAGLEYNYAFSRDFKLSVFFKNNKMFNSDIGFRHGILVGLKYRL